MLLLDPRHHSTRQTMFANDPLATGGVLKGAVEMAEPFDSGNE
jgi:hypothetical protein